MNKITILIFINLFLYSSFQYIKPDLTSENTLNNLINNNNNNKNKKIPAMDVFVIALVKHFNKLSSLMCEATNTNCTI